MSVVVERRLPGQAPRQLVLMKGAVERVLDACVARQHDDTSIHETGITRNAEAMASSGLRVLAVAARDWEGSVESTDREEVESGMTFLGLVGIYDPPRESELASNRPQLAMIRPQQDQNPGRRSKHAGAPVSLYEC